MRFKSWILGGAAIVGLATAGGPAMATSHPSTPEEQRQTDDLNAQQLASAQSQPATQTSQAAMPGDQSASAAPETAAAPSSQETTAMNAPAGGSAESPANAASEGPASSGTVALSAIANPPQTLANASVETSTGQAIGAVQKVVTDGNGKAQTVDVALLGPQSKIVAIDAAQLTYDQSRNVVVAQLSADQIQALPPAPQG